jgi:hypothetical protein
MATSANVRFVLKADLAAPEGFACVRCVPHRMIKASGLSRSAVSGISRAKSISATKVAAAKVRKAALYPK